MTALVTKLFKIAGVALIIVASLFILGALIIGQYIYVGTYGGIGFLMGFMLYFLGQSIQRLAKIEDTMGKYILIPSAAKKPLGKCEKCGRYYELEYGECPYCAIDVLRHAYLRNGDTEE